MFRANNLHTYIIIILCRNEFVSYIFQMMMIDLLFTRRVLVYAFENVLAIHVCIYMHRNTTPFTYYSEIKILVVPLTVYMHGEKSPRLPQLTKEAHIITTTHHHSSPPLPPITIHHQTSTKPPQLTSHYVVVMHVHICML